MSATIDRQQDGSIKLTITIAKEQVRKAWDQTVAKATQHAQLPGFRKGKAPKKLVEDNLDYEKVTEETLKELLPKAYIDAVSEHKLQPIINPRIHVQKIGEGKHPTENADADWVFSAETCEAPKIELGNYKDAIQKITAKSKIVIPGKEPEPVKMDDIVNALLESTQVTIPRILIDGEVERHLSQLLDDVKKLGLTLDQYLSSTGKTPDSLRKEYEQKAENNIKFEFAIQKVAQDAKIVVEEKEIEEAIQKAKSDEERKSLETNKYLLTQILRQQKTLDFLKNL